MKSKKAKFALSVLLVLICFALALSFVDCRSGTEKEAQKSESSTENASQLTAINETTQASVFAKKENIYSFQLLTQKENGEIKYGVFDGLQTIIPCEYDEISFLSESRILAQNYVPYYEEAIRNVVIYDEVGNIICADGAFSEAVFEKREGIYEQTGIGIYRKSKDLRQAEYWVIDQNGNKLSEAYTSIERVASIRPEEDYYAVRIDPDTLYMSSYRLKINGEVLEKVTHSHPDGVKNSTFISGKSGNYIHLYADGYYIEGYNNRIGGYDYVAFKVDNADDWQIGDTVEITHTGKIKYSDPPIGELIDIVKMQG